MAHRQCARHHPDKRRDFTQAHGVARLRRAFIWIESAGWPPLLEHGVVALAFHEQHGSRPYFAISGSIKKICKRREHFREFSHWIFSIGSGGVSPMESLLYFASMSTVATIIVLGALYLL